MHAVDTIFFVVVLIMSVVVHEVAHGHAANMLGDPTARLSGRLTLNPLLHIDPMGSIIIPLLLITTNAGFLFGWAKPVPYNPYNLRNQRWGTLLVGGAGVLANFFLALVFGLLVRFSGLGPEQLLASTFFRAAIIITGLNMVLGVFNLIPVPPLDGSKVLFSLLPYHLSHIERLLEQYWYLFLIPVFLFAGFIIVPAVNAVFSLITGYSLGLYVLALPF
ncbi:MAG: site-2 protease family protein [bacterium]|nr:site-2 protease family protein [bacterium]MDZ4285234.1 site-2 protease family protein [Patescibacteria group bacterium]